MKFFIDTADTSVIRELAGTGLLDGVTTNPTLVAAVNRSMQELIPEICALVSGPVSAEVLATETSAMIAEGRALAKLAKNVAVKLPLTWNGLKACRTLSDHGIAVNVTLCFSANQALLAAKAGAAFISPFIGRLDDLGEEGSALLEEIRLIYDNYGFDTQILAASIRSSNHVRLAALAGADAATIPPKVLKSLAAHPLTEAGLERFLTDARQAGIQI